MHNILIVDRTLSDIKSTSKLWFFKHKYYGQFIWKGKKTCAVKHEKWVRVTQMYVITQYTVWSINILSFGWIDRVIEPGKYFKKIVLLAHKLCHSDLVLKYHTTWSITKPKREFDIPRSKTYGNNVHLYIFMVKWPLWPWKLP